MTATYTSPTIEWREATDDLRRSIEAEVFAKVEAELRAEAIEKGKLTEDQKTPERIVKVAQSQAKGEAIRKLWNLKEWNGVRNPNLDDLVWGPNAKGSDVPTEDEREDLTDLVEFLKAQTWSDFAQSLATQYGQRGSLSPKQVAAAKKMKATMDAKAKAKAEKASKPETGLDLSSVPSGYYAPPGWDTRLKVRIARGKDGTKWAGWTFVSDGAEYGSRRNYGSQRPGGFYKGDIEDALRAIVADPFEAQKAYGKLWGVCGACGRKLEDADSIAAGIGPICAGKWAA